MYRKRESSLWGEKVVLVPYSTHHVPKSVTVPLRLRPSSFSGFRVTRKQLVRYHEWMQDPILRLQTGSEPLSLEEEYRMQKKWLADEDKCTFICLERAAYENDPSSEVECMAGDVNLFFNDPHSKSTAELELMIAESGRRRRGLGLEAAQLMMAYGISDLGVKVFRAKIGVDNVPSLKLFRDKLSFVEVSRSHVFQEITLELTVTHDCSSELCVSDLSNKWRAYAQHRNV